MDVDVDVDAGGWWQAVSSPRLYPRKQSSKRASELVSGLALFLLQVGRGILDYSPALVTHTFSRPRWNGTKHDQLSGVFGMHSFIH